MLRAFRSELIKVKRPWMVGGTYIPLIVFAVASSIFTFLISDRVNPALQAAGFKGPEELARSNGLALVLSDSSPMIGVVVVVVFASGFASEFGLGTLRNLLVRQPDRSSLLLGKFVALVDFVFVGLLLGMFATIVTATVMALIRDIPVNAWFTVDGVAAFGRAAVNLMLAAVGWASLGTLAALTLKSPGVAVGAVLAFFPVEGLVNGYWDRGPRWLPGQLLSAVALGGSTSTTYHRALALMLGFSLIALSASIWLFGRNDVTA
ncbi:MAG: hypothetical protein ACT4OM_10085 [Actinomycetota bacterium]